jgi:hypothetical protein
VSAPPAVLRLAELLVGLSRVADIGTGQESGQAARACLIATALARDLSPADAPGAY